MLETRRYRSVCSLQQVKEKLTFSLACFFFTFISFTNESFHTTGTHSFHYWHLLTTLMLPEKTKLPNVNFPPKNSSCSCSQVRCSLHLNFPQYQAGRERAGREPMHGHVCQLFYHSDIATPHSAPFHT